MRRDSPELHLSLDHPVRNNISINTAYVSICQFLVLGDVLETASANNDVCVCVREGIPAVPDATKNSFFHDQHLQNTN